MAGALLAMCVLSLFGAQRASAASWPWSESASSLQYPYVLGSDGAGLENTACAQTNQCVAVGYIYDGSNNEQAYVDPVVNGVPQAGVQVTLPADAASDPQATLDYVACQGDNTCTAVGNYENQSSVTVPMVVQITNGTPATAVAITPPANSVASDESFSALTCPSSGSCVAVGTDESSTTTADEPWVVTINAGTPTASEFLTPPSNDDSSDTEASLSSVACQSSSYCEAVGYYYATSGDYQEPMAVAINSGSPGTLAQVSLPGDALQGTSPGASLSAVACPAAGACEAMGYYYNSSDVEVNLVVPFTSGTPGTSTAAGLASGYEAGYAYGGVDGLSCSSASMCVAAGYYYNTADDYRPAIAVITSSGTTWTATSLPADESTTYPYGEYEGNNNSAVSCAPSGSCLATGWYYTSYASYSYSALEQVVSATGEIGAAQIAPAPSDTVSPQYSYLFSGTSCDEAGSCVTGGSYLNSSNYFPYEVSEQAPLSVTTSSLPAGSQHTAYQSTLAATGAWGVYTWSVSSGSLPAGLTLDSQTGVISGTPTAAGSFTFTVEATGTGGSPAPTATQSLSVTIAAVPPVIRIFGHTGLVKGNRLGVKLACSKWNCAGTIKVETRVTVKHGKKRVRRMVVIGSAHYSLGKGGTRVFNVKLNSAGRRALAMAKNHPVSVTILATVNGGKRASHNERIWTATKKHKK